MERGGNPPVEITEGGCDNRLSLVRRSNAILALVALATAQTAEGTTAYPAGNEDAGMSGSMNVVEQ